MSELSDKRAFEFFKSFRCLFNGNLPNKVILSIFKTKFKLFEEEIRNALKHEVKDEQV